MRPVQTGLAAERRVRPGPGDMAAAIGNAGVAVVATPVLIGWLEQASDLAIAPCFEPGEASVGASVQIEHVAAAVPGREVVARARVRSVDGRRVGFDVEARQGDVVVVRGRHDRVVVRLDRFLERQGLRRRADGPAASLTFWFDFHSPWCYLASHRVGDLCRRHGLALEFRPLHLPRLIEAIGGRRPLEENAAFVRWYKQDLLDWAALLGLPLRYHPQYPLRPARALRAAIHAAEQGRAEAFVRRVMRAYWAEAADIADAAVLADFGRESGLTTEGVIAATGDPLLKEQLARNTDEAIARGLFGVPSFLLGDKLYFGNDRLEMLERHLVERYATAETG